jgi:hypothetical protein
MLALACGFTACALAQEASPSLGDVARTTRKEHSATGHVAATPAAKENEDEDGPDSGGVWRVRQCIQQPCYELSVTLPRGPKWTRPAAEPRPVLIPLPGHEEDSSRAIRVYAAEALPRVYTYNGGTRIFLQGWFARPEYFGQAARLQSTKNAVIDGSRGATITQFTVTGGALKYRGQSVVATTSYGDFGFACVFRDEDASVAASICDAIVTSASAQTLQPAAPHYYPTYPPQYYPQYYPTQNPPEDDD